MTTTHDELGTLIDDAAREILDTVDDADTDGPEVTKLRAKVAASRLAMRVLERQSETLRAARYKKRHASGIMPRVVGR